MTPPHPARKPLILGIGNLLLGDEGIGVLAVQQLENTGIATQADIVDGGTGGFHLLGFLSDYEHIILIDATMDGQPPGTVSLIRPRFAQDFPRCLSAHEIGLKDLVESAALLGHLPRIDLITISIAAVQPMTTKVSPAVTAALPAVEKLAIQCLPDTTISN